MRTESIAVTRGDTWPNTLPITREDTGAAYDLTGADAWLTVKDRNDRGEDDADALFQLTIGDGITVDDPLTGELTVTISDERTELLTADTRYRYDVQVRKSGETFTPIGGPVTVARDVTRS